MTQTSAPLLQRRAALVIVMSAITILIGILIALPLTEKDHRDGGGSSSGPPRVGHIHGIAVDGNRLLVGSHYGVFSVAADGEVQPFGERRSDTMALAAVDGRLLASGHPSRGEVDAPPDAGLLVSDDGAASWNEVGLTGAADFHALDGASGRVWGFDAVAGRLLTTTDDRTWRPVAEFSSIDIAVDPSDAGRVFTTTNDGELFRLSLDGGIEPVVAAPPAAFVDSDSAGDLVVLGPTGELWSSPDNGETWMKQTQVSGQPTALSSTPTAIYVATTDGLYRSADLVEPFELVFSIEPSS